MYNSSGGKYHITTSNEVPNKSDHILLTPDVSKPLDENDAILTYKDNTNSQMWSLRRGKICKIPEEVPIRIHDMFLTPYLHVGENMLLSLEKLW